MGENLKVIEAMAGLDDRLRELRVRAETAEKAARDANADADMYANAWQRELNPFGFVNKRHHIDAMVVTTRKLVAESVAARKTLAAVEQWKIDVATARSFGLPDPDLLAALSSTSEEVKP